MPYSIIEHMFDIAQPSLFGHSTIDVDCLLSRLDRRPLEDGAWIDYAPGWCGGDEALFSVLQERGRWESLEVRMYDRLVQTPRLTTPVDVAWHPILRTMVAALSAHYGVELDRVSAALYRSGADSVAWHGDRIARELPEAIVATVSLGHPRRFLLRPAEGVESIAYSLGGGDLVVMGGSCQRTWRHAVPKTTKAGPRIALMFRHAYD